MTLAAQLMAAGANQQLIASNLRQEGMISESVRTKDPQKNDDDGEMVLDHGEKKVEKPPINDELKEESAEKTEKIASPPKPDPVLHVEDEPAPEAVVTVPELDTEVASSPVESVPDLPVASQPELPELPVLPTEPVAPVEEKPEELPSITTFVASEPLEKPTFGGELSATTAEAEEEKEEQTARDAESNNVALSHDESSQETADDAIEKARRAVESVSGPESQQYPSESSTPSPPLPSLPEPLTPSIESSGAPDTDVSQLQEPPSLADVAVPEEPDPVDAFMQPHVDDQPPVPGGGPMSALAPSQPDPIATSLTPGLPPLPGLPASDSGFPPLPPFPGADSVPVNGSLPPLDSALISPPIMSIVAPPETCSRPSINSVLARASGTKPNESTFGVPVSE
jgi:hypothetical protein